MSVKAAIFLCDISGIAAEPWAKAGFQCWCVDVQHPVRSVRVQEFDSGGAIHFAYGDVRSWTPPGNLEIVFMAAFPPCTHVSSSGAQDYKRKGGYLLCDAIQIFTACELACRYSQAPFFIENPRGVLSTHIRKADHAFNPCDFGGYLNPPGDAYTKETHLWIGNGFVIPASRPVVAVLGSKMHTMPGTKDRQRSRSETPRGFAQAVFEANAPKYLIQQAA